MTSVKEFYNRIQGDEEKELFLPSYAVSPEEMKKFKVWWAKILKQRKVTERDNLEDNYVKSYFDNNEVNETHKETLKPDGLNKLGYTNEDDYSVSKNHKEATRLYIEAEEQEDEDALVGSDFIFSYEDGNDESEELEEAMKWYTEAEEQEDEDALKDTNYAFSYENGEKGVKSNKKSDEYSSKEDCDEIIRYYINVAEKGGPAAQRDLGYKFQYGKDGEDVRLRVDGVLRGLLEVLFPGPGDELRHAVLPAEAPVSYAPGQGLKSRLGHAAEAVGTGGEALFDEDLIPVGTDELCSGHNIFLHISILDLVQDCVPVGVSFFGGLFFGRLDLGIVDVCQFRRLFQAADDAVLFPYVSVVHDVLIVAPEG